MTDLIHPSGRAYQPGVCNIGPEEIARRRRSAIGATIIALVVAIGMLLAGWHGPARLALLPFAAAAGVTWLQAIRKFCVAFGVAGIRNFGRLGAEVRVGDEAARAADRRTALRMILEGVVYGVLLTIAFWLLPL